MHKNTDLLARMESSLIPGSLHPHSSLGCLLIITQGLAGSDTCSLNVSRINTGTLRLSDPHQRWTLTFALGRAVH